MSENSAWDCGTGVEGMIRHTKSGRYYSRFQVAGRRTMKALKTDVWSVAKLRHADAMAAAERMRQRGVSAVAGTSSMADLLDEARSNFAGRTKVSEKTKVAFHESLLRLETHWPRCFGSDLRTTKPIRISKEKVREFASYLSKSAAWRRHNTERTKLGYGAVTVNKTIEALHRVMRMAEKKGFIPSVPFELGNADDDDADPIHRSVPKKKLDFGDLRQMREVFITMRTPPTPAENQGELYAYLVARANESADLAEFMTYSGARVAEATAWQWEDERDHSIILRGTKTKSSKDRTVPKIPAMVSLLERMKARRAEQGRELKGPAFTISQCREALATACKKVGVKRLTHHDLRHLFATICIESKVDIPTLSRWLGHADGGILAMKTYGHLRQEHSLAQAAKVTFGGTS